MLRELLCRSFAGLYVGYPIAEVRVRVSSCSLVKTNNY